MDANEETAGQEAAARGPADDRRLVREGSRLRAAGLAFAPVALIAAFWAYPSHWGAIEVTAAIVLAFVVATGGLFLFQVAQLMVDEPLGEVIRALFGQRLSLRNETRFVARVRHACADAKFRARDRAFSLVVLAAPEAREREGAVGAVRATIRARDVVSEFDNGEIWILAPGAGEDAARALASRLVASVGRSATSGWSAFDADGADAAALIASARQRAGIFALIDDELAA